MIARIAAAGLLAARVAAGAAPGNAPPASTPAPAVPVAERGLAIGEKAPAFREKDQFGRPRDLAALMGPKGLVLLFVRSADW